MWILIFLALSFFSSLGHSGNQNILGASNLSKDAKDYQCMLDMGSKGICSGTFIDSNLFLTAAHCLEFNHILAIPQNTNSYRVTCFNGFQTSVESLHIHPHYFRLAPDQVESKLYSPLSGIHLSHSYNDLAIVVTEDQNNLERFPQLAKKNNLLSDIENGPCEMLGFSPEHCNQKTGEGCFREDFYIFNTLDFIFGCNIETGKGCQIGDIRFIDMPSTKQSLMFASIGLPSGKGDSGAGIICEYNGDDYLFGVHVKKGHVNAVSISLKTPFIDNFLKTNSDKRRHLPIGVTPDPIYSDIYYSFDIFRDFYIEIGALFNIPKTKLNVSPPGKEYGEIYKKLRGWIGLNREEATYLFSQKRIILIDFGYALQLVSVDVPSRPSTEKYNILEISSFSTLEEVLELLLE